MFEARASVRRENGAVHSLAHSHLVDHHDCGIVLDHDCFEYVTGCFLLLDIHLCYTAAGCGCSARLLEVVVEEEEEEMKMIGPWLNSYRLGEGVNARIAFWCSTR